MDKNDVKRAYTRYLDTLPQKNIGPLTKMLIKVVFAGVLQFLSMREDGGPSPYPALVVYFDGLYLVNKKVEVGEDLVDIESWAQGERYGGPFFHDSEDPDSFKKYLGWLQRGFAI